MSFNLKERAAVVEDIARQAGDLAKQQRDLGLSIDNKGVQDFVTQADLAVEKLICQQLSQHFPGEGFFGEEQNQQPSDAGTWVIDPIDGTTNYIKGMDYWCVSIAFVHNNQVLLGGIYAPDKQDMYIAIKDQGSYLNGELIAPLVDIEASRAVIGIGRSNRCSFSGYIQVIENLHKQQIDYRRFGSAALSLAQIASGQVDAYYEAHLNSWDACAGWLVAKEAGASSAPFLNENALEQGNQALVANQGIYATLQAQIP